VHYGFSVLAVNIGMQLL